MYMTLINQGKWTNIVDGLLPIEVTHRHILEVLNLEN